MYIYIYVYIYICMVCELIETIKMECGGSDLGTPDDLATAQSFLSVPNPSRKRLSQFLAERVESKKRNVDLEGVFVKRRNEQLKLRKQMSDLQEKIRVLTQKVVCKVTRA